MYHVSLFDPFASPYLTSQHEHICDWCIVMCMGRPQPVTGNQSWTLWCDFFWNKLSLVIKLLQVSSSTLSVLTSRISWCVNFGLEELLLELVDCLDVHLAEFLQSGRVQGKRRRCGVEGLTNKVFSRPFESQWKFEFWIVQKLIVQAVWGALYMTMHACRECVMLVCVLFYLSIAKRSFTLNNYILVWKHIHWIIDSTDLSIDVYRLPVQWCWRKNS